VDISGLDFEHSLQRIRLLGAHATEAEAHTLTVMVTPGALARAKVVMRAELEHTRREEILAKFSSAGMANLDKSIVNVHDDRIAMTKVRASAAQDDASCPALAPHAPAPSCALLADAGPRGAAALERFRQAAHGCDGPLPVLQARRPGWCVCGSTAPCNVVLCDAQPLAPMLSSA
jgi:hypothetical protein